MKKIIGFAVDIVLIAGVFAITDLFMMKLFHSESIWLELGIYIVFYGIVFGIKSGIMHLWKRKSCRKELPETKEGSL